MTDSENKKEMTPEESGAEPTQEPEPDERSYLPNPGKKRIGRRNFISKVFVGCGAFLGLQAGYAGVKLLADKPVAEKKPVALSLSDLPPGSRKSVFYAGSKVEVIRTDKGIMAMSMVCTHLGCLVIWQPNDRVYHCPCHDAYFTEDGQVISGPPTQPLEQIPVTVSGNSIIIGG